MSALTSKSAAQLRALFNECGYVRQKSEERYRDLGYDVYKKGSEVRLVLASAAAVKEVQALLREVGLNPGKPFRKHSRYVQPIYGAASVEWFLQRRP